MKAIDRIGTIAGFFVYSSIIVPWLFIWVSSWFGINIDYSLQTITIFIVVCGILQTAQAIAKAIMEYIEENNS